MQKNTSNIYASHNRDRVESRVIEISESIHWSRRCDAISL